MTNAAEQYEQIIIVVPVRVGTTPTWIADLKKVVARQPNATDGAISIARVDYGDGAKRALAEKLQCEVESIRDALIVFERNSEDAESGEDTAFATLHQTLEILRQELVILAAL